MQSSTMGIALTEVQASSMDEELMRKAIGYIEEQIANPELSVERLSREMGMSRVNFYKKCLSITGKTPVELIRTVRLKRAAQLLEKSQMRVNEVALECGFNDVKLFRKYFKDEFGRLPSDYHKYGFLSAANPLILPTNEEPFFLYGKTCSDSLLIGNN